jgi:ABC-type polysaccharide/polyol phosphate transport system ATPase subunit
MSGSVRCAGVGTRFLFDRQRRPMTPAMARLRRGVSESWGLRDVTFEILPGESVALAGPNGAGKTTLLRVLAGVLIPDAGTVEVEGNVGSLLSIGGGLMAPLTGRENALLLGVLAGLSRSDARRRLDEIQTLSELGPAFERPVSSYSQGMRARLGFSVVQRTNPDVLLLDEVHEALDHDFRERVQLTAVELLDRGGVVIAAGHDHPALERFCSRALVLHQGHVTADGDPREVLAEYRYEMERAAAAPGAVALDHE